MCKTPKDCKVELTFQFFKSQKSVTFFAKIRLIDLHSKSAKQIFCSARNPPNNIKHFLSGFSSEENSPNNKTNGESKKYYQEPSMHSRE